MKKSKQTKAFKVASVSNDTNSFGLTGIILMAADGEAWEVGASYLHSQKKGDVIHVSCTGKTGRNFASLGFEIPRRLPDAPPGVIEEVWTFKEGQ